MSIKLLTVHHLEFLSLKGGCTGSSESRLVKIPHCWKSHVAAHIYCSAKSSSILFDSNGVKRTEVHVHGVLYLSRDI